MESLITILIPCRNEERYIRACLESVLAFTLPPGVQFELIVLDGRSSDLTRALIDKISAREPRVRWLDNPGITQSCALNLGLGAARGQFIMRLDAHTEYPADYLAQCHETAARTGAANTGGVCITLPGGKSYQAQLVQALTTHKFGVGDSGFRTGADEGPRDTVPFGFFRRDLFDAIGLFDERLVRAQDYEFNRRIKAAGHTVWLNPAIQSQYYNQPTLTAFYGKQFLKEAPYNAYLWYLAPYAFAPRHAITGVFAAGVLGGLALTPFFPRLIGWPFAAVLALYAVLAVLSALQQALRFRQPLHFVFLPFCFFLFHFIHGLGVLVGLARLLTGTAPVQKKSEPWPGADRFRAWPVPPRMTDPGQDREIERQRYNERAGRQLAEAGSALGPDGAAAVDPVLRRPYLVYEELVRRAARPGLAVLDLCCGDGLHSLTAARAGADVTASDIAENNLALARQRAARAGLPLRTVIADAEKLPLPDASFDLVTCAGSLSYVDLECFLAELRRVLRPGGAFIFVDSLNHNPAYRFNRFLHFLRGRRSRSTLERMPTQATLARIRADYPDLQASYHGVFAFLAPVLRLLGPARAAECLDRWDAAQPGLHRQAFKVVGFGHRPAG